MLYLRPVSQTMRTLLQGEARTVKGEQQYEVGTTRICDESNEGSSQERWLGQWQGWNSGGKAWVGNYLFPYACVKIITNHWILFTGTEFRSKLAQEVCPMIKCTRKMEVEGLKRVYPFMPVLWYGWNTTLNVSSKYSFSLSLLLTHGYTRSHHPL